MSIPKNAIEIKGLTKIYSRQGKSPEKLALDNVDLVIPQGSIFGLLGPNGAGKSTLINILAGLVIKTEGSAKIWDIDITKDARRSRNAIGIVPQELNVDAFFSPHEILETQAGLYGVPKSERITGDLLEAVDLTDKAKAYSRTLSGGMKRRLMVAKAMVHTPPVLILDEPTAGVDVELRQSLWAYIKKLNNAGTTIILTTHYLEEAEELCDRIAIINHGKIIECDTTDKLLKKFDQKSLHIIVEKNMPSIPKKLAKYAPEKTGDRHFSIHYSPSKTPINQILSDIKAANLNIQDITTEESRLEDVFLKLTHS